MAGAHRHVVREINEIIPVVVASGLADDQNLAYEERTGPSCYRVRYYGDEVLGAALRDRPYEATYELLRDSRSYNLLMLDGAMIQMVYEFAMTIFCATDLRFSCHPPCSSFRTNRTCTWKSSYTLMS